LYTKQNLRPKRLKQQEASSLVQVNISDFNLEIRV
jgi:hypothetical protein